MFKKLDPRHWEAGIYSIFFLGFASGLPFLLILSTLSVWLAEIGISKTLIGLCAWVSVPYALKFLWGPLVDRYKLPFLYKHFGLRRSWILLAQVLLGISVIALGNSDPMQHLWVTMILALLVGFSSAIQDIAAEAYRIEIIPRAKVGAGASASVLGYRFGMLCSGAGTMTVAAMTGSWRVAYTCTALFIVVGIVATLLSREPLVNRNPKELTIYRSVRSFMRTRDWHIIIPFILAYKISDTTLNAMNMPFLVEIGFNKLEIAYVAKTFGICAMIFGGVIGGLLLLKQTLRQNLFVCIALQAFASCLFIIQAQVGHSLPTLFIVMGVENFACGMSQVALIAYMSQLCSLQSTAFHYAILSSFASFVRVGFSAIAGWIADQFGWTYLYSLVSVTCLPSLFLLWYFTPHFAMGERAMQLRLRSNVIKGET